MDFIVFKFYFKDGYKEKLIRRDDVTLGYLRLQTRQVFKMKERKKFALSYEMEKPGDEDKPLVNRHYYCCQPKLRPDKLLVSDRQMAKVRKGRRKGHVDTCIRIIVHDEPELIQKYYQDSSPIASQSKKEEAFKERAVKSSSRSPARSKSRSKSVINNSQSKVSPKTIKKEFLSSVKIKADNTYDYRLPPSIIESFIKSVLNTDENMQKLKALYENLSSNPKPTYSILDYVNCMDMMVRKVEVELGIQDREVKITKCPSTEW